MNIILAILLSALFSSLCCYFVLRPKIKQTQILDKQTEEKNIQLSKKAEELYNLIIETTAEEEYHKGQIKAAKQEAQSITQNAAHEADLIYKKNFELAVEKLNTSLEKESQKYQEAIDELNNTYLAEQNDLQKNFSEEFQKKQQKMNEYNQELQTLQKTVNNAVAAAKRKEEMKTQVNFYRIQLAEWEIDEIKMLRNITPKLKNVEPLNKVIWKCYYEKPTTDLIGRVIGSGVHTGIYKITDIESQKCYVGQAANLADRWKQHIKRGIGAEAPTRNKLYPAMMEIGPENFTFEVIDECDRSLLDEREDYWQDYFKAKEFGYSIK